MSGEQLRVETEVLESAATVFGDAVDALNRILADLSLGDAATASGQLLTAHSCRRAQQGIAAAVTSSVESVREYGEILDAAVRAYAGEDAAAADDVGNVEIES